MSVVSFQDYKGSDASPEGSGDQSRVVHLPVAPQVTARTRFASSLPRRVGFLMPEEALGVLEEAMETSVEKISMAAISGPGDPLAVPDTTFKTIALVKDRFPQLSIGIKTLGIGGEAFAPDLARAGVEYVELLVNGVRADILERLYAWIRPGQKTLKITDAVQLMLREQCNCIPALKYNNIKVSVLTTLYPGYNLDHIRCLSRKMMELGAGSISLVPYVAEADAEVSLEPPTPFEVASARKTAAQHLPVIDAPVLTPSSKPLQEDCFTTDRLRLKPQADRPNVAVLSSNGMDINLHLGQAVKVLVYGPRGDGLACLLEARKLPGSGTGSRRWKELAAVIPDCFALLTSGIGNAPRKILSENGIRVVVTEENIEGCVDVLYGGGKKGPARK